GALVLRRDRRREPLPADRAADLDRRPDLDGPRADHRARGSDGAAGDAQRAQVAHRPLGDDLRDLRTTGPLPQLRAHLRRPTPMGPGDLPGSRDPGRRGTSTAPSRGTAPRSWWTRTGPCCSGRRCTTPPTASSPSTTVRWCYAPATAPWRAGSGGSWRPRRCRSRTPGTTTAPTTRRPS